MRYLKALLTLIATAAIVSAIYFLVLLPIGYVLHWLGRFL